MKAIVNTGPGRLEWLEQPTPEPGPGQVRIRTAACGICATDLAMIAGWDRTGFPSIPGHEWAGVVDAVGPGISLEWQGCPVVAENVLSDGGEVGFQHPGGYGECFLTEGSRLHRLPPDFPLTVAALIEPLAVCVRGLRRWQPQAGEGVLVLGDGLIGLLMVALLRREGFQPIHVVGGRRRRLEMAQQMGAAATLDYHEAGPDLLKAIRRELHDHYRNVVEASGSALAMEAGMAIAGNDSRLLVLGDYGPARASFPWLTVVHRELQIIGSNASAGAWEEAIELATGQALPLASLVTHVLPARRFKEAVELARSSPDAIKVVLQWELRRPGWE